MDNSRWLKIKEIFYPVLELPAAERHDFIETKCAGDESLREEIAKLLDSHEAAEDFIESPTFAVKNLLAADETSSLIGEQIGSYKIEREIGRGGMGAVYLGSRADAQFEKQVAVKLIKRGLDTDEIIRRFRHERQILATLDHPNIARLIDGGATDDGLPFLVMDYVEGLPLMKFCQENALSINKRLNLFLLICSAVAYAHRNLIVHRDLKPSNILVTFESVPKLLDFGNAKLLTPEAEFSTLQTATNLAVMTPEYASPEQVKGEQITTATDVYSLGVLLYELLTDLRPYHFTTRSLEKIIHTVCQIEPPRPSSAISPKSEVRSPKSQSANHKLLSGDLDNIVLMAMRKELMAMRKEPERRYSSVEQFAADVRRHLEGLPVVAREDDFSYRAGKFVKRNRAGVIAASGIAVSLIGEIIATFRQSRIAARQRDTALAEAEKAERINQFLQKMLAAPDPRVIGKDVKVLQVLDLAAQSMKTDFAAQPEIAADLRTTIGLTYLSLGLFEKAEPLLQTAMETRRKIFGRNHRTTAMSLNHYGKLLQGKGDLSAAEPFYLEALTILESFGAAAELDAATVLDNLGYLTTLQGESEKSVLIHRQELEIRRRHLGENHPETARAMGRLGGVLSILEDWKNAEFLHRQALAVFRKSYGEEHPDTALELINLVGAIKNDKPAEAKTLALEALKIRRNIFTENHPEIAWSLYNLAYLAIRRGDAAEAAAWARQVLAMRDADLPNEHPTVSSSLLVLGRSMMAAGEFANAKKLFEECLALRQKTLPENHWLLATTRSCIGECLMVLGQTETGEILLAESYKVLKNKFGKEHEQTRLAWTKIEKFFNRLERKRLHLQ